MERGKFEKKGPALPPAPHPDEQAAVARAAAAGGVPEVVAHAVISTWIVERARRAAGVRITSNLAFDLGDARLRGYVEAALPHVAEASGALDLSKPVFELGRDDVVSLFVAAIQGAQASAVAHGESDLFPFDDPIPFGEVA